MEVRERIQNLQSRIQKAAERSKFGPRPIALWGASKDQRLSTIRAAADAGILDMGENYAQELLTKAPMCLDTKIRWHYIGKLQSNKVKHILPYVSTVSSVDSLELADKIARTRELLEKPIKEVPVLLQVNLGSERQKAGLSPAVIENLFGQFLEISGLSILGLMAIPPQSKDPEKSRPHFQELKKLFDRLKEKHRKPEIFEVLSMGMSRDFEIAVEEGSTCVRIGEALFGPRPKKET